MFDISSMLVGLQHLLPQHLLSRVVSCLAETRVPLIKNALINAFIKVFGVDLTEAKIENAQTYENFNAFFTRALKSGVRPIANGNVMVSPADGCISQVGYIQDYRLLQAKGRDFRLEELLADDLVWVDRFRGGQFMTVYLSPKDYHRVHMPMAGKLMKTLYVPGQLFSVNQTTVRHVPRLFARNERLICYFETLMGPMAVILVGAMIVAGIESIWAGYYPAKPWTVVQDFSPKNEMGDPVLLEKGEELGRFKLGSTAIILTPHRWRWDKRCFAGTSLKMGQQIAVPI